MNVNLVAPSPLEFSCQIRVLYGDTDAAGVVYYANYLRYFERGRTELLRVSGLSYRELEEQGVLMPVVECHARYKAPARYDELVKIRTSLAEVAEYSCRFLYRLQRLSDGQLLVKGQTRHAVTDRAGKLVSMSAELLAHFRAIRLGDNS